MIQLKNGVVLECDGSGLWGAEAGATVEVTKLAVPYVNEEEDFGELRVYFDAEQPSGWDIRKDGLIYTDDGFESQLRDLLFRLGFSRGAVNDVDYSEQGMQGENFVSLDVGKRFLNEWLEIPGNNEHTSGVDIDAGW